MQKWEYHAAYLEFDKKQKMWVGRLPNGTDTRLSAFLTEMGENGWELCGTTQAYALSGSVEQWFAPDHFLYFKRPKE